MLRIVGGNLRGRRISTPPGRHTRPTADRVREGIFNVLANRVSWEDCRVLDLFAGSGALGIEALSRGAAFALFVESHHPTARVIGENLRALGVPQAAAQVVTARVESWLARPSGVQAFNLVLLDPPYDHPNCEALLQHLATSRLPAPGALIVLENARHAAVPAPPGLESVQTKRYGDTQVNFLQKSGSGAH